MDFSSKKQLAKNFVRDIQSGKYNTKHYVQRKEGQWNKSQKSLLIDSIFRDYPIDPIRAAEKEGIKYIFDGIQRGTTIAEYINNKFSLSKRVLPILINDVPYETAGKRFEELDQALQDKIYSYEMIVYIFTNCTDDDIREMYLRQNNGKSLTPTQKRAAIEPKNVSEQVNLISEHPFFKKALTKSHFKNDKEKDIVRETLMLLNSNEEHPFSSFEKGTLDRFVVWYGDNFSEENGSAIVDTLDLLDEQIDGEIKYLYSSLPMIIYAGIQAQKEGKDFDKFVEAVKEFSNTYESNKAYQELTTGGTRGLKAVTGRVEYWKNIVIDL